MDPVQQFLRYREEDRHESDLLASRTNTLLTSQSFFVVAAAALYAASSDELGRVKVPFLTIAVLAATCAFLGGRAIRRGFEVLRAWHVHGEELIRSCENKHPNPIEHCYLPKSYRPDSEPRYRSVDFVGSILAYLLSCLWLAAIVWVAFSR